MIATRWRENDNLEKTTHEDDNLENGDDDGDKKDEDAIMVATSVNGGRL